MTLECEDTNSNLVDIVTVADFDAQERVGNSLTEILNVKFC